MAESGGTTTQSGIYYQNSIAALYLGRLVDSQPRSAIDRVVEVRVEAPEHEDDIVIVMQMEDVAIYKRRSNWALAVSHGENYGSTLRNRLRKLCMQGKGFR